MKKLKKSLRPKMAVTLVEIIITMGVLAIMAMFMAPNLANYYYARQLDDTANQIVAALKTAQTKAVNGEGNTFWGVAFDNINTPGTYSIFSATVTTIYNLPSSVQFSNPPSGSKLTVTFNQLTGQPQASAVVTIRSVRDPSQSRTIEITGTGMIKSFSKYSINLPVNLTATNSDSPRVVVDKRTNTAYVIYSSWEYSGQWNIALRNSANWTNRVDVTTNADVGSYNPAVAVDRNGVIHVAYESNEYNSSFRNIAYRNSTNWANRVDITTNSSGNSYSPSIAIDSNGVAHIAYQSREYNSSVDNIAYRKSTNWSNRTDITTNTTASSYAPSLGIDSNGAVHVAYMSYEYNSSARNIAYRNSTNWANRVDVTATTSGAVDPSLARDFLNNIYVAYASFENNVIYKNLAYRGSQNWGSRIDATSDSVNYSGPSLAVDGNGILHIGYQYELASKAIAIAYRNSTNWANQIVVTAVSSDRPSIDVDSNGAVHMAYRSVLLNPIIVYQAITQM